MRIATWNVNSIRTRVGRVTDWLQRSNTDVLAMQEIKCKPEQFPVAAFEELGYQVTLHGLNQWNGVAFASRMPAEDVEIGFADLPEFKEVAEARAIGATINGVRIWSLYVPNGRTLDQVIGDAVGHATIFNTLEISCNGFTAPKEPIEFDNISWYGPGRIAPSIREPQKLYDRLFLRQGFREHVADVPRGLADGHELGPVGDDLALDPLARHVGGGALGPGEQAQRPACRAALGARACGLSDGRADRRTGLRHRPAHTSRRGAHLHHGGRD